MKCTLLPQGWIIPGETLIPPAAVFIALALSACGGSNVPAPIVTRMVTASPSKSTKPSVKAVARGRPPQLPPLRRSPPLSPQRSSWSPDSPGAGRVVGFSPAEVSAGLASLRVAPKTAPRPR
jgi:hypothetical protein